MEEFNAKLVGEINNIELHFKNIINLLNQKKDKMIHDLKSSMITNRKQESNEFTPNSVSARYNTAEEDRE